MTNITFSCSSCGQMLKVGADKAGKRVKCAKCGTILTIPAAEEGDDAPVAPLNPPRAMTRREEDDDGDDERPLARSTGGKGNFTFNGGAGDFLLTGILAYILTVFTLGIGFPWAFCMIEQWKAEHTFIEGRQLRFKGTGGSLLGHALLWALYLIITLGIYSFWLFPAKQRWIIENTDFDNA